MATNNLLEQAYTALKAGRKQEARQLLEQVIVEQPNEFRGWLWLASVTDSPQAALAHVEQAARLNPTHRSVVQARAWAQKRVDQVSVKSNQYSVESKQVSVASGAGTDEEESKRPFTPLLWAAAAALLLLLLLGGSWWIGYSNRTTTNAAQESPPLLEAASVTNLDETAVEPIPTSLPTNTPTAQPRSLIQAKSVSAANEPLPTWTPTPLPTATPTPTPTPEPTFVANSSYVERPDGVGLNERWIDINLTTQTLTAYEGDELVFSTLISSGVSDRRTVTGQFRVWHRTLSQTMDGGRFGYDYYLENVPYVMYFYRDFAIHGAYWHNNFGTPMSSGCVNMKVDEAEWLFNWSQMGTLVNVRY